VSADNITAAVIVALVAIALLLASSAGGSR
jgi:hypothetical protein